MEVQKEKKKKCNQNCQIQNKDVIETGIEKMKTSYYIFQCTRCSGALEENPFPSTD